MPLFTSKQLSNEAYHALPEIGGSSLVKIYNDCPAAWKYGENEPSKALVDGIAAHVCVLEPSLFAERFVRGIDPADYPDALVTAKDIEGFLRDLGRKGYSGKSKAEVIAMALETDNQVQILDLIIDAHAKANDGKTIVKPKDFDMITAMRGAIYRQPEYRHMLTNTVGNYPLEFELSFISPNGTKVRWDCITADGAIEDYKTCISSHPNEFSKSAARNGYWLKMAFQHDHFVEAFGERPKHVGLLAQSKKHPYIPQNYILTEEQLRVGRQQYQEALDMYNRCMESGAWPAYGGGSIDLPTPSYLAYEYGMEEAEEIEYLS
jgi:hypothetical protein